MKSILYQPSIDNPTPLRSPATCLLGRKEQHFTVPYQGVLRTFIIRDKVTIEDPYCSMVKAVAVAQWTVAQYGGIRPSRLLKDFLLKHESII